MPPLINTIFITIATCKEPYLLQTIKSALVSAEYPENLYFGIFNNILDDKDSVSDPFITENDQIFYVELRSKVPMGVGYSRLNSSLLYKEEYEFMFQIDAHAIFSKHWDTDIIKRFRDLEKISDKPIITAASDFFAKSELSDDTICLAGNENMPISFDTVDEAQAIAYGHPISNGIAVIIPNSIPPDRQNYIPLLSEFESGNWICGYHMFSRFSLAREVLHDPMDVFGGDETNYSLRLLSSGYTIYITKSPLILSMNKFGSSVELLHDNDWRRHIHNNIWHHRSLIGVNNAKDIFSGRYIGYWGAKDIETLQRLKKQMGIEYYNP